MIKVEYNISNKPLGKNSILLERGEKVGNCVYIQEVGKTADGARICEFLCQCGVLFISRLKTVKLGRTTSCGCVSKEMSVKRLTKHDKSHTHQYMAWISMKRRCENKKGKAFHLYGGRGISVCERWKNSYEDFAKDMGDRPSKRHSVDRINVNGNYEPGNCRWATCEEQANNRRNSLYILYNGETKTLTQWCNELGLTMLSVYYKLRKNNYLFNDKMFDVCQ